MTCNGRSIVLCIGTKGKSKLFKMATPNKFESQNETFRSDLFLSETPSSQTNLAVIILPVVKSYLYAGVEILCS